MNVFNILCLNPLNFFFLLSPQRSQTCAFTQTHTHTHQTKIIVVIVAVCRVQNYTYIYNFCFHFIFFSFHYIVYIWSMVWAAMCFPYIYLLTKKLIIITVFIMHKRCRHLKYGPRILYHPLDSFHYFFFFHFVGSVVFRCCCCCYSSSVPSSLV